jgi:bacillithiol biosynthesis cysteine-adding enzyme BshC
MQIHRIPHATTQRLPDLASRVVSAEPALAGFYRSFANRPDPVHVQQQKKRFTAQQRQTLNEVLTAQYHHIKDAPTSQIDSLLLPNCFTITTGHQLNLFTGPLYFLYKIIDVIQIANQWNALQDGNTYVPVYWMASEDHDFEEINHFSVNGQSIHWSREQQGPVGRLSTEGLDQVLEVWKQHLGDRRHSEELQDLFAKSYVAHSNLADATRFLVDQLFGRYGLVIVDGDDARLKQEFIPYLQRECEEQLTQKGSELTVKKLNDALQTKMKAQVNPRDINLFYMVDSGRQRIEKTAIGYRVVDTEISFSKQELIKEIKSHPERFSPNALFRPIYQELVLPNLVTVGGGSEVAYWLQLSEVFSTFDLPIPMLKLRSSVLLISDKQQQKLNKLDVSIADLFLPTNELINHRVRQISNIDIDLGKFKAHLDQQFGALYALAKQTDASFLGAVEAQEKKQKKGIDRLEKRLLKAQRIKLVDHVNRLTELQQHLFPMGDLQERRVNFAEFVLQYGDDFIPFLIKHIDPNEKDFMCFSL